MYHNESKFTYFYVGLSRNLLEFILNTINKNDFFYWRIMIQNFVFIIAN